MRSLRFAILGVVVLAISACGRRELAGPPSLRLGRDECAECGMTIQDERCAGAFLVERLGRREHLVFDDIGCMLHSERAGAADFSVIDRFVHDRAGGAWLPARGAAFLIADISRLPTPMGSGIVAFADRARALEAQQEFGGEIADYTALGSWSEAQAEARKTRKASP